MKQKPSESTLALRKARKAIKRDVWFRDRFICFYCGRNMLKDYRKNKGTGKPQHILTVDHIIPKSAGGTWAMDNLVTACHDCNCFKKDSYELEESVPITNKTAVSRVLALLAVLPKRTDDRRS